MAHHADLDQQAAASGKEGQNMLLDFEKALERTMGDKEFLVEMFQEFMQNAPGDIESLKNLLAKNDAEGIKRQAHRMKGSAANLSFLKIAAIAMQLENTGRDNALSTAEGLIQDLEKAIHETKEYVSRLA